MGFTEKSDFLFRGGGEGGGMKNQHIGVLEIAEKEGLGQFADIRLGLFLRGCVVDTPKHNMLKFFSFHMVLIFNF